MVQNARKGRPLALSLLGSIVRPGSSWSTDLARFYWTARKNYNFLILAPACYDPGMRGFFKEFKEFASKGSAFDLAVGVILGAGFKDIVDSLVNDIIMPPLGLLISRVNFNELFWNLSGDGQYQTVEEAKAAGAVTINYGLFLNNLLKFVIIALVLFLVVKQINRLRGSQSASASQQK